MDLEKVLEYPSEEENVLCTLEEFQSKVEYRKTTYMGEHSVEEVFEGCVEDVIKLVKVIYEMEKE